MIAALRDRVLSIGADSADSSDLRFRKRLLVGIALLILPAGLLWGCIYWAVGEEAVALTPWAYVAGSIISLAVFARNRNFPFLRTAQFLLILARGRDEAQARVETLLLNVLPEEVAQRLQADPNSIADHFDDASILFADVVDFTPLASRLDPRDVVGMLDRLFTAFDELVDRYEVEKIKTIGDCYMVAAGVPRPRPEHAQALAGLALGMKDCARTCLPGSDVRLRIGISSGPVVAGVIGRRRFLYDLWGDTVNMASRMGAHGTSGEIQITRPTWTLLRDDFVTEPIGLVDVKGKGEVETWRLVSRNGR